MKCLYWFAVWMVCGLNGFIIPGAKAQSEAASSQEVAAFNVTATGTSLQAGSRVIYFDGLGREESLRVYHDLFYGGLVSALLRNAGLFGAHAFQHSYPHVMGTAFAAARLMGTGLYAYSAVENMRHIWNTGVWYALPALFSSLQLYWQLRLFGIPAMEWHGYALAIALKGAGALIDLIKELNSRVVTQYVHIPLTGHAGRHFMVRAVFPDNEQPAFYEVNRTALGVPDEGSAYGALAVGMQQLNIDRLEMTPDHTGRNILHVTLYDPVREQRSTIAISDVSGPCRSNAPWLLNVLHTKQNRLELNQVKSILAPELIQGMAEALHAYACFWGQQCKEPRFPLQEIEEETYLYTTEVGNCGLVNETTHKRYSTEFLLGYNGAHAVTLTWENGWAWPNIQLNVDAHENLAQLWIPEWFGRFLSAEVAGRGRLAISNGIDIGSRYFMEQTGLLSRYDLLHPNAQDFLSHVQNNTEIRQESLSHSSTMQPLNGWFHNVYRRFSGHSLPVEKVEIRSLLGEQPHAKREWFSERKSCGLCGERYWDVFQLPGCQQTVCANCLHSRGRQEAGALRPYLQFMSLISGMSWTNFNVPCPLGCEQSIPARVTRF